jgi:hypothetical protein
MRIQKNIMIFFNKKRVAQIATLKSKYDKMEKNYLL